MSDDQLPALVPMLKPIEKLALPPPLKNWLCVLRDHPAGNGDEDNDHLTFAGDALLTSAITSLEAIWNQKSGRKPDMGQSIAFVQSVIISLNHLYNADALGALAAPAPRSADATTPAAT